MWGVEAAYADSTPIDGTAVITERRDDGGGDAHFRTMRIHPFDAVPHYFRVT
jgi:hypothetical protein